MSQVAIPLRGQGLGLVDEAHVHPIAQRARQIASAKSDFKLKQGRKRGRLRARRCRRIETDLAAAGERKCQAGQLSRGRRHFARNTRRQQILHPVHRAQFHVLRMAPHEIDLFLRHHGEQAKARRIENVAHHVSTVEETPGKISRSRHRESAVVRRFHRHQLAPRFYIGNALAHLHRLGAHDL